MTKKLNTTGSLWLNNEGNAFSYNTQLTGHFKGLSVFNNTYYSMTTRKHQGRFNKNSFDLILTTCKYSTRLESNEVEKAIKDEIADIDWQFCQLVDKRNTQKKKQKIQELYNRKEFLVSILSK